MKRKVFLRSLGVCAGALVIGVLLGLLANQESAFLQMLGLVGASFCFIVLFIGAVLLMQYDGLIREKRKKS